MRVLWRDGDGDTVLDSGLMEAVAGINEVNIGVSGASSCLMAAGAAAATFEDFFFDFPMVPAAVRIIASQEIKGRKLPCRLC